jgi:hypothetical protein
MAARDVHNSDPATGQMRLGLRRCALTGAVALAALFALCWLGTAAGLTGSSHMFISLFTLAPVASAAAFGIGVCWSLLFGAISGALIAIVYNASSFLGRS